MKLYRFRCPACRGKLVAQMEIESATRSDTHFLIIEGDCLLPMNTGAYDKKTPYTRIREAAKHAAEMYCSKKGIRAEELKERLKI